MRDLDGLLDWIRDNDFNTLRLPFSELVALNLDEPTILQPREAYLQRQSVGSILSVRPGSPHPLVCPTVICGPRGFAKPLRRTGFPS